MNLAPFTHTERTAKKETPVLRVGCWYIDKVGGFGRRGDPILYHGIDHPKVILRDGPKLSEGSYVIYEITDIDEGRFIAYGSFREMYEPNPNAFQKP